MFSFLFQNKPRSYFLLAILVCFLFFLAYSVLAVVRHNHFQSFGYDLGINDQTIWRYSRFEAPVTTIAPFPDKPKLYEHVELVYMLISPIYWIWDTRKMLLIFRALFVCAGGIPIYLLARNRKLSFLHSFAILFSYLAFFGIQNAVWFDVHSVSFGTTFLAFLFYFLETKKHKSSLLFFLLAITSKENFAFITFFIGLIYFIRWRNKFSLLLIVLSLIYSIFIFFIYFPYIIHFPYLYENKDGLLSNLNPLSFFNTIEKQVTIFYTLFAFGFLPILTPLAFIPAAADLATYFMIGSDIPGAQGLYMHYRITLAPLLAWATILTVSKYKILNHTYVALYLIVCTCLVQYTLHLPLSYLSKQWFWQEPKSVKSIQEIITNYLPQNASVTAQNNIVPHISHRDKIYSLYPTKKHFETDSPCGKKDCNWMTWYGTPEFLLVDTSSDWDIRHLLANHEDFIDGIKNLEKQKIIKKYKQINKTVLYKVSQKP